jgi:hypothetical protein
MARTPRKTTSKKAGRPAAQERAVPTKRGARKQSVPTKAGTRARGRPRKSSPQSQSWFPAFGTLITSPLGREILADVLEAAAAVLRKQREVAKQVADAGEAAVKTTGEVASLSRDMAQATAGALADATTDALRSLLPEPPTGAGGRRGRPRT